MGSYLVYTILLAVQLVGFESIDRYSLDILQESEILHSLGVRTDDSVLRFVEGEEIFLEVERSRLYAHMYTTYTSAAEPPRAFSLLDAILQIPPRPDGSFTITLRGESVPPQLRPDGLDSEEGAPAAGSAAEGTPTDGNPTESDVPVEASWEIVMRESAVYLTASMRDLVVVLH